MKRPWTIDKKISVDANVRDVLPKMYDAFAAHAGFVAAHPRGVTALHRMRIDGKPLRYLIELCLDEYGDEFRRCYREVKDMIELMGTIHDVDVTLPLLRQHLTEVRAFNRLQTARSQWIPLKGLRQLLKDLRKERRASFEALVEQLSRWETTNFREKLLHSMQPPQAEVNQPSSIIQRN